MSNLTRHINKIRTESAWAWLRLMIQRFLGVFTDKWLDLAETLIEGIETSGLSGKQKREVVSTVLQWAALKWGRKVPSVVVNLLIEAIVALWILYDDKRVLAPGPDDDKEDDPFGSAEEPDRPEPEPEDPAAEDPSPVDPGAGVAEGEEGDPAGDADRTDADGDASGGEHGTVEPRYGHGFYYPIFSDEELKAQGFQHGDVIIQRHGGVYTVLRPQDYHGGWSDGGWVIVRRID